MNRPTVPGEDRTSPSSPVAYRTVEGWLASAHPSPGTVRDEWGSAAKVALIPLGQGFEAVRILEGVVHAVARSDEPSAVGTWLARRLGGPVIHDPGFRRYYALVPPGTAGAWPARGAECLSEGTYLGVPRPDRTELDEFTLASYWSVPVARPGHLCRTADVKELVILGRALTDEDES